MKQENVWVSVLANVIGASISAAIAGFWFGVGVYLTKLVIG